MPFFSVIIPVYNVEKYLDQCIRSVLTQPFKDLEAILVDDGSTDSSGKMCDDWAARDSRVRVIHQQNGGLGQARNAGLRVAKGEWILFLDSDDYWCDNCLPVLAEKMKKWPDEKVFVTKWLKLQNESKELIEPGLKDCQEGIYKCESLYDAICFYEAHCGWAVWKLIIHRNLICERALNFLPDVRHGEDLYWVISLFCRWTRLCILHTVLCCYRVQPKGTLSELSSENAIKWMDDVSFTLFKLESEGVQNSAETLSWLANIFINYMIIAAEKQVEQEWKKRHGDIQKVVAFLQPINASKKARCIKIFSGWKQCTWLFCRALHSLMDQRHMSR